MFFLQGPLTKHQKLSLVRTQSTFSFEDLSKLNINLMTYYRKKTPSERELIARKLRNSSLGKRKPRRAIRRKQQNSNKGAELTVSEMGTGTVGSPNVKSAAGSLCGDSICGGVSVIAGSGDGESVISPSGNRGSLDNPALIIKQPSPTPRPTSSKEKKKKRKESGEGCAKGKSSDKTGVKIKKLKTHRSLSGGTGLISGPSKPMGSGVRVSGRVKAVNDKDRNRFILETDEPGDGHGSLGDTIFSLLGLRMTLGEEMRKLGSINSAGSHTSSKSPSPNLTPTASGNFLALHDNFEHISVQFDKFYNMNR